jgi:hypothetical protein
MALRKGFPKERNYDFWNVLMCYFIYKDASRPEKERILFGTLAYRLISKAAEAVPTDKVRFPTRLEPCILANHEPRTSFSAAEKLFKLQKSSIYW